MKNRQIENRDKIGHGYQVSFQSQRIHDGLSLEGTLNPKQLDKLYKLFLVSKIPVSHP